jgi:L-xylulokinase
MSELWPAQTAVLLKWFSGRMPEVLSRTNKVLSIKDYIRMKLTNTYCYEPTETTCNGLMNIHTQAFDPAVFSALGLSGCMGKMPAYTGVTDVSGRVTASAAAETGLTAGTPVAGSCYDVNACALASGILDENTLCIDCGFVDDQRIPDANAGGTRKLDRKVLPARLLHTGRIQPDSTNNFEWFIDHMLSGKAGTDRGTIYRECDRMAGEIPPKESELIFVPYLFASATHSDAKGAFPERKQLS